MKKRYNTLLLVLMVLLCVVSWALLSTLTIESGYFDTTGVVVIRGNSIIQLDTVDEWLHIRHLHQMPDLGNVVRVLCERSLFTRQISCIVLEVK